MTEANEAGAAPSERAVFDDLVERLKPTARTVRACGFGGAAGGLTLMTGLQLIGSIRFRIGILDYAPHLLVALAIGLIAAVLRAYRMHESGSQAALVLSGVLSLVNGAWQVFMFSNGVISLVGMLTPPASLAAVILFWRARPDFRAAGQARQTMEDSGMDLGF